MAFKDFDSAPSLTERQALLTAVITGWLLWAGTSLVTGRREAWDTSLYWMLAHPTALLCAAALGYLAPTRPWRWPAALMGAQALSLAVSAGSWGLLPLGLVLFGFLALPALGVAAAGANYRLRRRG